MPEEKNEINRLENTIKEWLGRMHPKRYESEYNRGFYHAYTNVLEEIEDIKSK